MPSKIRSDRLLKVRLVLTTTAAIATQPGVIDLSPKREASPFGPDRRVPEGLVTDVGPLNIVLSIY